MSYNPGSNRARYIKPTSRFTQFLDFSDFSLNCFLLGSITIINKSNDNDNDNDNDDDNDNGNDNDSVSDSEGDINNKTRSLKNLKPRFSNSFSLRKTLRNI